MRIVGRSLHRECLAHQFRAAKLYTDEGIEGVGEATLEWKIKKVVSALAPHHNTEQRW